MDVTHLYEPTGAFESHILKCIWRLSAFHEEEQTELILPKGTAEIIFNFSENIVYQNPSDNIGFTLPDSFINGLNLKPFKLIKRGQQEFLGIQLQSAGLKLLFDISADEFNNSVHEGSAVDNSLNSLADKLFANSDFNAQVQIILNWIFKKVPTTDSSLNYKRLHYIQTTSRMKDVKVAELSKKCFLSERQMHRFCLEWLGMNPASYLKYQKYLCALQLVHNSTHNLGQIGARAGYYDQSHFIREFKAFAHMSPKKYQGAAKGIPGHIYL